MRRASRAFIIGHQSSEIHTKESQRGTKRCLRAPTGGNAVHHTRMKSIQSTEDILNSLQERIYNTGRRIQAFLDANDAALGTINKSGMRAELDAVVIGLGQSGTQQAAGRVNAIGETAKQRALRLGLRINHMQPIASVARAKLHSVPNFHAMTMPDPNVRVVSLIAHAHGMAEAAGPYEQVFVDAGLAPGFLAALTVAADAVKASIDTRATAAGQRSNATASLRALQNRARLVFRALNDFVVPLLLGDAAKSGLLAQWRSARHVPLKGGPVSGAEQAAHTLGQSPPTPVPVAPGSTA